MGTSAAMLAISRAIARANGGDLTYWRDSEVTRLELTLPGAKRDARALVEQDVRA